MKPTGASVAAQAVAAVAEGIPYAEMDCQMFVEQMVKRVGGEMAYAGSNDMARNSAIWLGTVENAIAEGRLVPGAGLLIHEDTEDGLPAKYRGDGLGDFSHVGLYVGSNALTDVDKYNEERDCDVVHSGQTMGRVAGSTIQNGWTHVIWFREIDYGADAGGLSLGAAAGSPSAPSGQLPRAEGSPLSAPVAKPVYVRVETANGRGVRIRERPERGAITKYTAPEGERLRVTDERNGFYQVMFGGKARWVDKRFVARE